MIDFDPPDQRANDIAAAVPVQLADPGPHSGDELQAPDDQHEVSLEFEHLGARAPFALQPAETLFQAGDARLEFGAVDDPFGISINQSVDPATEARICSSSMSTAHR